MPTGRDPKRDESFKKAKLRDRARLPLYFICGRSTGVSSDRQLRRVSDSMATQVERQSPRDGDSEDVGRSLLDELLTASQVAALLQMRLSTVESYARRGLLPSVKVGRHRRFVRSQVEQALSALIESA
jgi:excisionase family DNA binding protein